MAIRQWSIRNQTYTRTALAEATMNNQLAAQQSLVVSCHFTVTAMFVAVFMFVFVFLVLV